MHIGEFSFLTLEQYVELSKDYQRFLVNEIARDIRKNQSSVFGNELSRKHALHQYDNMCKCNDGVPPGWSRVKIDSVFNYVVRFDECGMAIRIPVVPGSVDTIIEDGLFERAPSPES